MIIRKKVSLTTKNFSTRKKDFGTLISEAKDTIYDQFSDYAKIDEKFELDISKDGWYNLTFTMQFDQKLLHLLKLKDYDIYNLLEDID